MSGGDLGIFSPRVGDVSVDLGQWEVSAEAITDTRIVNSYLSKLVSHSRGSDFIVEGVPSSVKGTGRCVADPVSDRVSSTSSL